MTEITEDMVARGADALFDILRAEIDGFTPTLEQRVAAYADATRVLEAAFQVPVSTEGNGEVGLEYETLTDLIKKLRLAGTEKWRLLAAISHVYGNETEANVDWNK